ncbi:hypothetical protein [Melittangium boletus]|nr:hypothetical protein [Melittangium boletus]
MLLAAVSLCSFELPGQDRLPSLPSEPHAASTLEEAAPATHVIRGTASLTNQNPVILELLAKGPWNPQGYVFARSTSPTGHSAYTYDVKHLSPTTLTFELEVEASAGGEAGVVYELVVDRGNGQEPPRHPNSFHFPLLQNIRVKPIGSQPLPTEVELKACLGVVQFDIGQDENCETLAPEVSNLSIDGHRSYGTKNSRIAYIQAGTSSAGNISYDVSTPHGVERVYEPFAWEDFKCDEVVRICKPLRTSTPEPITETEELHPSPSENPAVFEGAILLANPSIPKTPGLISTLQHLYFAADHVGQDSNKPRGAMSTSFTGRFNPDTGELSAQYEQALPSTDDFPLIWLQQGLRLRFWSQGKSFDTHPGLYDAKNFRNGTLELYSSANRLERMSPGERHRSEHEYCFNELKIAYRTELGLIYNPAIDVSGGYQGTDWREKESDYTVTGSFYGDPYVSNHPVGSHPRNKGILHMTLPQGTFTLKPRAMMVNESGEATRTRFSPMSVTVGCGQFIDIVPPLAVNIHPVPRHASSGWVTLSGVVTSTPAEVGHIWYQVNDGPDVTLCTNCGKDAPFSFTAPLLAHENTLKVFAYTDGMEEPAMSSQQVVWDDGPSTLESEASPSSGETQAWH